MLRDSVHPISPKKAKPVAFSCGESRVRTSNDDAPDSQVEGMPLCASNQKGDNEKVVTAHNPYASPYGDSEEDDADGEKVSPSCDLIQPNFTSRIMKHLDTDIEVPPMFPIGSTDSADSDHFLIACPPGPEDHNPVVGSLNSAFCSRTRHEISSRKAPEPSRVTSTGETDSDAALPRKRRVQELMRERRALKSEIILLTMQRISLERKSHDLHRNATVEKLKLINRLVSHFRRNDLSSEPLSRSLLNVTAEWLSPLRDGKLPPSPLRKAVIHLIKKLSRTTPAHVFRATSIGCVLNFLLNHPKESRRNKKTLRLIVNLWADH